MASVPGTLVFYEAAGRLAETLADLALELGPRPAAVARELTKLHEEVRRGALDKLAAEYAAARAADNFDVAAVIAGEAVGLIHDVPPAAEIVDRIVTEAEQILNGQRNSFAA